MQKYGGSSVADVARLGGVADRVVATHRAGPRVVVVVSAMGNTTNELLALAREVSPAPGRRELDMLVSVGERISMALLAMAIQARGVPAMSLTGSQSGIITDERHSSARVVEVRADRVRAGLEQGFVVIVAGFQGVSRAREVTTLGRGGSDTTAVVLAAALGARWCEICSDVDGVYTADPRVVPDALRLDTLSLDEALALARNGGTVLHDEAVAYARRQGVEIVASATFGTGSGSRLVPGGRSGVEVVAVTSDDKLLVVRGSGAGALVPSLAEAGAGVRRASPEEVVLDLRNWHDAGAFAWPPQLSLAPACEVAAVVGGVGVPEVVLARGSSALASAGVTAIAWDADGEAVRWRVAPAHRAEALRVLHARLIARP